MTAPDLAISYQGGGRGYKHPKSGTVVPSVTTVLNIMDKPALPRWAAKEVATFAVTQKDNWVNLPDDAAIDMLKGSPYRKRDGAASAGTNAHEYAEKILRGRISGSAEFEPPGVGREAANVRALLAAVNPTPIVVEGTCWSHEYGYAGSFDGIHLINGELAIVDLKSGSGIYKEIALQLAAYKYADCVLMPDGTEIDMPQVTKAYAWHVPKEGTWSVREIDVTEYEHYAFRAAVALWTWEHSRGSSVVGPMIAKGEAA